MQDQQQTTPNLPKPWMYDLWAHLHNEHGLTLVESELSEIVRLAAPGWQPIETLSEPDQDVLLWGMLDCETRPGCHKGCLKRTGYGYTWFESVTSPDGCNRDEITSVTHWMPLPCELNKEAHQPSLSED